MMLKYSTFHILLPEIFVVAFRFGMHNNLLWAIWIKKN